MNKKESNSIKNKSLIVDLKNKMVVERNIVTSVIHMFLEHQNAEIILGKIDEYMKDADTLEYVHNRLSMQQNGLIRIN